MNSTGVWAEFHVRLQFVRGHVNEPCTNVRHFNVMSRDVSNSGARVLIGLLFERTGESVLYHVVGPISVLFVVSLSRRKSSDNKKKFQYFQRCSSPHCLDDHFSSNFAQSLSSNTVSLN